MLRTAVRLQSLGRLFGLAQLRANPFQPLRQFLLEAARHGPVILALDTEIILRRDALFAVVRVLVSSGATGRIA
jgi:hypothetical protein